MGSNQLSYKSSTHYSEKSTRKVCLGTITKQAWVYSVSKHVILEGIAIGMKNNSYRATYPTTTIHTT